VDDFLSRLARSALAPAPQVEPLMSGVYAGGPAPPAFEVVDEEAVAPPMTTPPPRAAVEGPRHEGVAPSAAPVPLPEARATAEPEPPAPHDTLPRHGEARSEPRDVRHQPPAVPPQRGEVGETSRLAPAPRRDEAPRRSAATGPQDSRTIPPPRTRAREIPTGPRVTPPDGRPEPEPGVTSGAAEILAVPAGEAGEPPADIRAITPAARVSPAVPERESPRSPDQPPTDALRRAPDVHVHVADRAVSPVATPAAEEARAETHPAPVVRITIGRVEVRAIMPPAPAPRPAPARPAPALSLDDYLKQQTGGSR
jgi:hypothetical protein